MVKNPQRISEGENNGINCADKMSGNEEEYWVRRLKCYRKANTTGE